MKYPDDYIDKIICGDCLEVMKGIPNSSIDLTVTSPPYDDLREYGKEMSGLWKYSDETHEFWGSLALEFLRITKTGGVLVWIVGDQVICGSETGTSFRQALTFLGCGFNLHDTMIYKKDSIAFPEVNRYSQVFEYMFVFSKFKIKTTNIIKDRKNIWTGNKKITGRERQKNGVLISRRKGNYLKEFGPRFNIWEIPTGYMKSSKDIIAFQHPAIFPEKLAKDHILSWSNEGDIVLDPYCGSGTTCKMAKLLKRHFIGIEINPDYCKIAEDRLRQGVL